MQVEHVAFIYDIKCVTSGKLFWQELRRNTFLRKQSPTHPSGDIFFNIHFTLMQDTYILPHKKLALRSALWRVSIENLKCKNTQVH
jgi:hypothetical protein